MSVGYGIVMIETENAACERSTLDKARRRASRPRYGWWIAAMFAVLILAASGMKIIPARRHAAAVAAGVATLARVERLDNGDCFTTPRGYRCVRLSLELHPSGHAPYEASLTEVIDTQWISRVQPGAWLTVSVDAHDPNEVYFDERSMAVEAPKPPSAPDREDR